MRVRHRVSYIITYLLSLCAKLQNTYDIRKYFDNFFSFGAYRGVKATRYNP